jgi:peptidoglycan/xylan/chitin deacetylase (PgdA/CDA1 family)
MLPEVPADAVIGFRTSAGRWTRVALKYDCWSDPMDPAIPVLMYHQLAEGRDGDKYTLARSTFQAQMQCLHDLGLRGISVGELLSGRRKGVVGLTFDDGNWSDAAYAWPVLRDLGFSATFYVTAGHVSQCLHSSWEQLRDLARSGAEIGCHGRTHCFLDTSDRTVLEYEIAGARRLLEDRLGIAVNHFSLPGGRYSTEAMRVCGASGFMSVATSRPGYCAAQDDPVLVVLDRFVIHQNQSQRYLRQVLEGNQLRVGLDRLAYHTKRAVNGLVGNRLYHRWHGMHKTGRRPWSKPFFG